MPKRRRKESINWERLQSILNTEQLDVDKKSQWSEVANQIIFRFEKVTFQLDRSISLLEIPQGKQ